ncbi:MAG TPA: SRPBCC domain-containing protein [Polyangiaceae bacterium]|nr:SRPBCC domain-containing protein [Polyangiaceae bacterium]
MELRTEIEISASPSRVWETLVDFPRYAEWNPFIPEISGDLRVGAELRVVVAPPGGNEVKVQPTLLVVEPVRELRWRGKLLFKGLFAGEHFMQLVELAPGRTRFVHGENFTGVLVKLLGRTLTQTARGFVFMNQALKQRVEDGAT